MHNRPSAQSPFCAFCADEESEIHGDHHDAHDPHDPHDHEEEVPSREPKRSNRSARARKMLSQMPAVKLMHPEGKFRTAWNIAMSLLITICGVVRERRRSADTHAGHGGAPAERVPRLLMRLPSRAAPLGTRSGCAS